MLISSLDDVEFAPEYPELVGRRVLVTGVAGSLGVEIVRAFAEAQTRLVVQTLHDDHEAQALAEIIAPTAMEVSFHPGGLDDSDAMLRFAREAAQKFGGLDCIVNIAAMPDVPPDADETAVEGLIADALAMPVLATRVGVNRMRTMLNAGVILNVLTGPSGSAAGAQLLGGIARTALASFTRNEANSAEADGVRINAVVPASVIGSSGPSGLNGSVDVATLAMHLASGRGHELSGLVFEAYWN